VSTGATFWGSEGRTSAAVEPRIARRRVARGRRADSTSVTSPLRVSTSSSTESSPTVEAVVRTKSASAGVRFALARTAAAAGRSRPG